MSTPTCYALLVGIDKYQSPVPPLDGCVNDMRAMRDYLVSSMSRSGIHLHLEVLENEKATRLNIVQKFEKHLAQAQENDLAFFYYSGHGSQETTHEVFQKIEEDDKNETIVCYDSRSRDGMDLADKELATLLDVVAQTNPHLVVIMDCCNSGSGTRDFGATKVRAVRDLPARVRSLDSYILPKQDTRGRSAFNLENPEQMVIPSPRHVALSAAQSFQLAKETLLGGSPRGVFTYSLLEVLNTSVGPLTYADLMRRVRSLVTERTFEQTPQLYAPQANDQNLVFLKGSTSRAAHYYALSHDQERGWHIDAGSAHGIIGSTMGGGKTLLNVFAEDATDAEMNDPEFALGQAQVTSVYPGYSQVTAEGNLFLAEGTTYRTRIHDMPVKPLQVVIKAPQAGLKTTVQQAMQASGDPSLYLKAVDQEGQADYKLIANDQGQFVIARQTDTDEQPLVEQIHGLDAAGAKKAVEYLVRIARWERLLDLRNPGSSLPSEAAKVEIMHPDKDQPLGQGTLGVVLRYNHSLGKEQYPRFRVRVNNAGSQRLYCGLLYLSSQYQVKSALPQGGVWLEPGQSAWVANGSAITGQVNDSQVAVGRNEIHENFKLIFSNREFDARLMEQPALGQPKQITRNIQEEGQTRALIFGSTASIDRADWNSNQINVTLIRED